MGGTSSNADLASLRSVLTFLYLSDWGSSVYSVHLGLSNLPSFITSYEYCLEILPSTLRLTPFHIRGVHFLGGSFFSWLKLLRVSICFYLTCGLEDHAWPMGYYSVPRGCGVLSASEICLVFFLFSFFLQLLSYASHPVWSLLNWIYI